MNAVQQDIREGLTRAFDILPPRAGYIEGQLGHSSLGGSYLRGEAGIRPRQDMAVFAFAESNRDRWDAGLGWRWQFNIP